MFAIYLAQDPKLDRKVALKILPAEGDRSSERESAHVPRRYCPLDLCDSENWS
jgi:hypothetical protein